MSRPKLPNAATTEATKHYLSSIRRSMERLDTIDFDHYNMLVKDIRLVRYILAKAYVEKRHIPDLAAEILFKGLQDDKTFRDYFDHDLELSITNSTAMTLRTKQYCAQKREREQGHSSVTAT